MVESDLVAVEEPLVSENKFLKALIAGGAAGTSVDVALFPIDTIKTRLQSPQGFLKAGGFKGIYRGLGAAAVGSAPGAALFFSTYETMKPKVRRVLQGFGIESEAPSHMISASIGEVAACLVRVPTEVVKTRMQTNQQGSNTVASTFRLALQEKGSLPIIGGLYNGFGITVMREVPFAFIQFPIYERSKRIWAKKLGVDEISPIKAAACGSFSGGIAAALTTPLDVIKTRTMLGVDKSGEKYNGALDVLQKTLKHERPTALFSGIQPRVFWISLGGFVFFGAYETYSAALSHYI